MEQLHLYSKISYLPSDLKSEVSDFIDFLLNKRTKRLIQKTPVFGCAKGQIYTSPDFDKPLDDFNEYMR
jgi:hypothetical protein